MEKVQRVVVGGLLIKEGEALIVRRSPTEHVLPNLWELPSGKVDFGEDPVHALIREYKEETALDIEPVVPVSVFHYVVEKPGLIRHTIQVNYLVRLVVEESVKLSPAHLESKWVTESDLDCEYIDDVLRDTIKKGLMLSRRGCL